MPKQNNPWGRPYWTPPVKAKEVADVEEAKPKAKAKAKGKAKAKAVSEEAADTGGGD